MSSLTHTLTHTVKFPYGTSGTRSAKEDAEGEGKGLKMPIQRHLKGFGTFVISRSRVRVASLAPERKGSLVWEPFLSGVSDFAICAKPSLVGSFLLRF